MPWILDHAEKFVNELNTFENYPNNLIRQNYIEVSKVHESKIAAYNQKLKEREEAAKL